jgi:hypothetical protein
MTPNLTVGYMATQANRSRTSVGAERAQRIVEALADQKDRCTGAVGVRRGLGTALVGVGKRFIGTSRGAPATTAAEAAA